MEENITKFIKAVEKTPGKPHIEFAVFEGKKITFGDDELTINLAAKERDDAVTLDICFDNGSGIVIGVGGTARRYAAQIDIPARRYDIIEDGEDEITGEMQQIRVPIPFDISLCTLTLWEV
ncbi:MAG: hypothetical protein K2P21_06165 [Lachnospiraceae bacterium]|nr:hypothetical protein [Lachnospiraceae bacterium]